MPLSFEITIGPDLRLNELREEIHQLARQREGEADPTTLIARAQGLFEQAMVLCAYTEAVQLQQEIFIIGQHQVMTALSEGKRMVRERQAKVLHKPMLSLLRGILTTKRSLSKMQSVARQHKSDVSPDVAIRNHRFAGKVAEQLHAYPTALQHYQFAAEYFREHHQLSQKWNWLEMAGLEAGTLLQLGRIAEGLDLTRHALDAFDNTAEGSELRSQDLYTFSVWKTGIQLRTARILCKRKDEQNASQAAEMLREAHELIATTKAHLAQTGDERTLAIREQELNDDQHLYNYTFPPSKLSL